MTRPIAQFLIALILATGSSAFAEEKEDTYEIVDSFTECAAIQNVLAMIDSKSEEEYKNHFLHQTANGALIAAMVFSDFGGYKKVLVESLYEGHLSKLTALRKGLSETGDFEEWNNIIGSKTAMCGEMNKIQAEIIKEKRKQVYQK